MQVRRLTLHSNESLRRIDDRNDSAHDGNGDAAGNQHLHHGHGAVLVFKATIRVCVPLALTITSMSETLSGSDCSAPTDHSRRNPGAGESAPLASVAVDEDARSCSIF